MTKIIPYIIVLLVLLISCQEPTKVNLDSDNDPSSDEYIPEEPSNLKAEVLTESILLNWVDNSEAEGHFVLERSIESNPFSEVATISANTETYEDEVDSLSFDSAVYRISAVGPGGISDTTTSNSVKGKYVVEVVIDGSGTVNQIDQTYQVAVDFDSTLSFEAVPFSGWVFSKWIADEEVESNPYSLKITANTEVTATFKRLYDFDLQVEGNGSVKETLVRRKSEYQDGDIISLNARADTGWSFIRWEGDITGTDNPRDVNIDKDNSVVAVFEPNSYLINTSIAGVGSVSEELVTGEIVGEGYAYNSTVRLTTQSNNLWRFLNWSGEVSSTDNSIEVTLTDNINLNATFIDNLHTINVTESGSGVVNLNLVSGNQVDSAYTYGSVLELTPSAEYGWAFSEWTGDNNDQNPLQTITLESDISLVATFREVMEVLQTNVEGSGSISEQIIPQKTTNYRRGTSVQLSATADAGWEFDSWIGDTVETANPIVLSIDSETDVTARFIREYLSLGTTVTGQGAINIDIANGDSTGGAYELGSELTLTAEPADSSWYFDSWTGDLTGEDNPATYIVDDNSSIQAIFKNSVTDIDGNEYQVVRIGNQTWMQENLRVVKFNDGTELNYVRSVQEATGKNNLFTDPDLNPELVQELGYKYRSEVYRNEKNICPNGWIVPSGNDYDILEDYARTYKTDDQGIESLIEADSQFWSSSYPKSSNSLGFTIKGSGYIEGDFDRQDFSQRQVYATNNGPARSIYFSSATFVLSTHGFDSNDYYSIRCLKVN